MFITHPELTPPGKPGDRPRAVQSGRIVELSQREPYLHATFAMKTGDHREFLADSWSAIDELRHRRTIARLVELHYVTPPVQADGLRSIYKLVSISQSKMDDPPTNDVVFVFRASTGVELIEGEWLPNQFLGVSSDRVLVLTL